MYCLKMITFFQRVMLDDKIENRYPRYSLYAYGEGVITKRLRRMKFTGIPVLFIPGNAGSHEQGLYATLFYYYTFFCYYLESLFVFYNFVFFYLGD